MSLESRSNKLKCPLSDILFKVSKTNYGELNLRGIFINFYSIITTIQFGIKITTFCDKFSFLKALTTRFELIASVPYQGVSHTENQNSQFFLRSKRSRKKTKKTHNRHLQSVANNVTKTHSNR